MIGLGRQGIEHGVGDVGVDQRVLAGGLGQDVGLRTMNPALGELVVPRHVVEMGVAGDGDHLLGDQRDVLRRLTTPQPESTSRSRSRPRRCQSCSGRIP